MWIPQNRISINAGEDWMQSSWRPDAIDTKVPSVARMYDYFLGATTTTSRTAKPAKNF